MLAATPTFRLLMRSPVSGLLREKGRVVGIRPEHVRIPLMSNPRDDR
jgi:hypothetical protein